MTEQKPWYEVDASWNIGGYADDLLMKLGNTDEWMRLVAEAAESTHATVNEVWDGMATAIVSYLESLDNLRTIAGVPPYIVRPEEDHVS